MFNKKQFGAKMNEELAAKYARSPQWNGKKFENLVETKMGLNWQNIPELLYKQFFAKKGREPKAPLPVEPFDKAAFLSESTATKFIWYGHAVVLLRMANKTILIDPMLGPNASPIAPFETKRFSENTLSLIDAFPEIDIVLMTHDHYDHLDLVSIEALQGKVQQFIVALGVGRHLEKWGIAPQKITEMDWWDTVNINNLEISFTPTRHFSGRGLRDREHCLWGGWVLKTEDENIYFSGDGGYGQHFKEVGERLGPFDFGFMECGQYNKNWRPIHLFPTESVQAARDAQVARIMPFHWAGFALAQHTWKGPAEDFVKAATAEHIPYITPKIGQLVDLGQLPTNEHWWENME
ncbi:MAG: MBL fold metallo-hydrolase [Saprospiraceae bacterium]|nr:MBL fold metallo-hydrolase [Saprospiraceae bacterium]